MVRGLVGRGGFESAHPPIEGVSAELEDLGFASPAEVVIDRLPDHRSKALSAPGGLVLKLPVGRFGKTKIGRNVSRHRDITVLPRTALVKRPGYFGAGRSAVQFRTTVVGITGSRVELPMRKLRPSAEAAYLLRVMAPGSTGAVKRGFGVPAWNRSRVETSTAMSFASGDK